ncbi:hypothetical protein NEFER03_1414 [Nematocida sp. LUAm3]|nr:hypothetical protein NEFER03_1414 [Nematocida sp. LUAm3]KAI5177833.1 hypothetical protein NEFER01_1035 [Nematocida sp. LUAm1]
MKTHDHLKMENVHIPQRNKEKKSREKLMLSMNSYSSILHPVKFYAVSGYSPVQPISECNKVIEGVLSSYLPKNYIPSDDTFSNIIEEIQSSRGQFYSFLIEINKYLHTPIPFQFEREQGPPVYNENIYNTHTYVINTPEEKDKRDTYRALYFLYSVSKRLISLKKLHPEEILSELEKIDNTSTGVKKQYLSSLAANAIAERKMQQYKHYTHMINRIVGPLEENMTYEQLTNMIIAGAIQETISSLPNNTFSFEGERVNAVMAKYFKNLRTKYKNILLCFPFLYKTSSVPTTISTSAVSKPAIVQAPSHPAFFQKEEEDPDVVKVDFSDIKEGKKQVWVKNNDGTKKYSLDMEVQEYTDYPEYKYRPVPFDRLISYFPMIILVVYIISAAIVTGVIITYFITGTNLITTFIEKLRMSELLCKFLMVAIPIGVYSVFLSILLFHAQTKETKEYLKYKKATTSLKILVSIWFFSSISFLYFIHTTSLSFAFILYTVALLLLIYGMIAVFALRKISWLKNSEETGASVNFDTREIIAEPYLSRNRIRTDLFFKSFYLFIFLFSLSLCAVFFYYVSMKRMELLPSMDN